MVSSPFVYKATTPGTIGATSSNHLTICIQGHHAGYNGKEGRWYPHLLYTRPPRRVQLVQLPQIILPFVCKATTPGTMVRKVRPFVCKATTPGTIGATSSNNLTICMQGHHAGYNWWTSSHTHISRNHLTICCTATTFSLPFSSLYSFLPIILL